MAGLAENTEEKNADDCIDGESHDVSIQYM
jgi:hypothetical protein